MNSPKEKALELVEKYKIIIADHVVDMKIIYGTLTNKLAKQCALIAVDELISISLPSSEFGGVITNNTTEYWNDVRNEINKL
jgi:hypothetical protein